MKLRIPNNRPSLKTLSDAKNGDLALQIAIPVLTFFAAGPLFGYLALGAVQIASCVYNKILLPKVYKSKGRTTYEIVLVLLIILGIIAVWPSDCPATDNVEDHDGDGYWYLFILLLTTPVMAISYFFITVEELNKVRYDVITEGEGNTDQ